MSCTFYMVSLSSVSADLYRSHGKRIESERDFPTDARIIGEVVSESVGREVNPDRVGIYVEKFTQVYRI